MSYPVLYLLPFVSALAAGVLSRVALAIAKRRLVRRRAAVIQTILQDLPAGTAAADKLRDRLSDSEKLAGVKPLIEQHVDTFLHSKLQEKLPVIAMFASPDMLAKIKEGLLEEIDLLLPEVIGRYAGDVLAGQDLRGLIAGQAAALSPEAAETLAGGALDRISAPVMAAAALFGFVVGSVPLVLFYI